MATLKELLNSMLTDNKEKYRDKNLPNTKETWERIGLKDSFTELGFSSSSELNTFLKEWMEDNDYTNIN